MKKNNSFGKLRRTTKMNNSFIHRKSNYQKQMIILKKNCRAFSGLFFRIIGGLLIFLMAGIMRNAHGQGRNQEVTIIAPYQPSITDAVKIPVAPQMLNLEAEIPDIAYSISSTSIPTSYHIEPLKPVFIQIDPEKTLRRNFLKAGFGNYSMPYAEFFSNSLSSDKYSLGFHVRHLSSKGEIKDHPVSAFSQNYASVYGKRYLRKNVLAANIHYDRNVVHYYGFDPLEGSLIFQLPEDDLRQRFSHIGTEVSITGNSNRRNGANYMAGLSFYHLSDLYETAETSIGLKSNINSKNRFLRLANEEELGVDFNANFLNNSDSLQSQLNILTAIEPYLSLNFDYLDLTIGAGGALAADSSASFFIYPNVKAFFKVIPDHLRVYFAATGGVTRNSFRSVSAENPWINSIFPFGFSNTKYEFKGGVTGKINMLLDFNLSVSYADVQNMMFFINDYFQPFSPEAETNFGNKFTGVYDDAQVTAISLEVGYEQPEMLNLLLVAGYREYKMAQEEYPWHKPALEAGLMARYYVSPQLSVSGDLLFSGKSYAKLTRQLPEPETVTRKAFLDVNIGAEYRFNDKVAAFAQLNNLIASRYYRWYNYPSQRINLMGGLSFAF
jgi:hypothetical protein